MKEVRMPYDEHQELVKRDKILTKIEQGRAENMGEVLLLVEDTEEMYYRNDTHNWRSRRLFVNYPNIEVLGDYTDRISDFMRKFQEIKMQFLNDIRRAGTLLDENVQLESKVESLQQNLEAAQTKAHRNWWWAHFWFGAWFVSIIISIYLVQSS